MGEHVLHTVFWDDLCSDVYLYGSDVRFNKDGSVYFESLMMPSGMTVKKWKSSSHFQSDRIEPSLPMLIPGKNYMLRAVYDEMPAGSIFMRLDFFDQQNEKNGTFIMEEKCGSFQCPENTYSYTAELVQGGAERVRFDHFELFPESDKLFYQIMDPAEGEPFLNFLIPERTGRSAAVFDEDIPKGLTDYIVLSPFGTKFTGETLDLIMKEIAPPDDYDGLRVYLQDKNLYKYLIRTGWQTQKRHLRLWKAAEDE